MWRNHWAWPHRKCGMRSFVFYAVSFSLFVCLLFHQSVCSLKICNVYRMCPIFGPGCCVRIYGSACCIQTTTGGSACGHTSLHTMTSCPYLVNGGRGLAAGMTSVFMCWERCLVLQTYSRWRPSDSRANPKVVIRLVNTITLYSLSYIYHTGKNPFYTALVILLNFGLFLWD